MTPQENKKTDARILAIRSQIAAIGAMLDGTLMVKHNRTQRKDGSVRVSPEHYTFQYRGADGRRRWKRIPEKARRAVERLVRNGRLYRELEREYAALMTEASLADYGKKNA